MNTLYTARLYMKTAMRIFFTLFPLVAFAQAPAPFPVTIDSQRGTAPALEVFQANEIAFRVSYKSGGVANNITTEFPFMYWQPYGATNATVVTGTYSIVNSSAGVVDFTFEPNDLNFAAGVYTYQAGLEQSGGPLVIKQGAFTIKPSAASIGAEPIIFATTNINWGNINWSGVPDWDLITNVNAKLTTLSNNLQSAIDSVDGGQTWSGRPATQNVNFAQYYATNMGGIDFDLSPSGAVQPARMQWKSSRSTLELGLDANVNLDIGQQLMLYAKSIETNQINKGEVVFVAGASGDNPTIKRASNASEALSARTIGIAAENIASNNNGFVVTRGTIYNVNTTNFAAGANLYLGANGTLQTNLPAAPLHGVFIGTVERVGENNGQIFVAVQNYQELEELSDVKVTNPQNNDLLAWNTASNRWQNTTIEALGISGGLLTNELDPVFVAASNSFYPRSNPSNFITTAALSGYATGTPLYAESDPTAITNVTASGRLAATKTGKQVALTFDGTGLATGTPLYAYTETDPVWTAASSSYYTASQADALFATGSPVYSVDLTSYLTSTGATATYLPLAGGTMAGGISMPGYSIVLDTVEDTGSVKIIDFSDGAIYGPWDFSQQPTIPGYLTTSTWASADSTTNYASRITFNATSNAFNTRITDAEAYTNRAASALSSSVWATADSTTNYTSRVLFNASSNAINTRLVAVESYTNRAASALSSSVWASADSTTNYMPRTGGYMSGGLTFTNSRINMLGQSTADGLYLGKSGNTAADSKKIEMVTSSALGVDNTKYIQAAYSDDRLKYHAQGTTHTLGYLSEINTATTRIGAAETRITAVEGYTNRAATALASNVWASADSTTNYTSRITFNATSNKFNTAILFLQTNVIYSNSLPAQIVTTNNLSTIAGSGLGVTDNKLVVTNVAGTVTTNDLANYLPLAGGQMQFPAEIDMASGAITNISYIGYFVANSSAISFEDEPAQFSGNWVFNTQPVIPGYVTTNGNAAGLTNFPSSLLTVSAGNANYWRITTAPTGATASGSSGQMAVSGTNLFIYSPNALGTGTGRWGRVNLDVSW